MNTNSSDPTRIAFCITELDPGGAERCLVELARRLDRRRFAPVVYCLGPRPRGNPTSFADALDELAIETHYFGATRWWQFATLARRLRRQMIADAPRIVQTFLFHANVLGVYAAHGARVPHIVTGIRVAERGSSWHLTLARLTARWSERHVCVSQSVRDFSRDAGLSAEKLLVIPNGVDLARFASVTPTRLDALGIAEGRRAIVFVGRLEEQKGLPWLLELLPRLFAELPAHDLVIVGSGPQREQLQRTVERLALKKRVHLVGYRTDVAEILSACDMLVLPSRWEGMPNVILEAMASGKPAVATQVEGVCEALGPGAAEQSVAAGDSQAFVAAIVRILRDSAAISRLGAQNRQRISEHFQLDAMVASYEQLYSVMR